MAGSVLVAGCAEDDEEPYRKVAQARYTEIWQSTDLEGRVCPQGAEESDRQIEELASALRVTVPDNFRVIAFIEPSTDAVKENWCPPEASACIRTADDPAGSPLLASALYLSGHETVHAVQRLRDDQAHRALREGEAVMFADFADSIGYTHSCGPEPVSEEAIREVLDQPLAPGAYSVFLEIVARVYQDYGPEAFDMLWAASAEDPSTEGLLAAFEDVLGTTLFELMQRPSLTCRDLIPGCAGLERVSLTSNVLTMDVPRSCDEATSGLVPGNTYHSFVLKLEQAGDLAVSFSSANGIVALGKCDGFDDGFGPVRDYGFYSAAFGEGQYYPLEAGLYRAYVMGNSEGPAAQVHFAFTPSDE